MQQSLYRKALAAIARDDLDAVTENVIRVLETDHAERLVRAVLLNQLQGMLLKQLEDLGRGETDLAKGLSELRSKRIAFHLASLSQLQRISQALRGSGLTFVALKGPVLSELVYENPGLRPYGDLDILVSRHSFRDVLGLLEHTGFALMDRNWSLLARERRAQVHLAGPLGVMTDLHWHLLNREAVRRTFTVDELGVIERAHRVQLSHVAVDVPSPTDTLLHICLHSTLSGGWQLRQSVDIARCIAADPPDWTAVVTRAAEWSAETAVGLALRRAMLVAEAQVPGGVCQALLRLPAVQGFTRFSDRIWTDPAHVGANPSSLARDRWRDIIVAAQARLWRRFWPRSRTSIWDAAGECRSYLEWVDTGG